MNFKKIFTLTMALFVVFTFTQCDQDQPSVVEPGQSAEMPAVWTAEEMIAYFDTFDYPEDPADYKIQFYNSRHRSQLTVDELAIVEAKEMAVKEAYSSGNFESMIESEKDQGLAKITSGGSSLYFYVLSYDSYDYGVFYGAHYIYDDAGLYYASSEWNTDTDDQTLTSDVIGARAYLHEYATYCDISTLKSTTTSNGDCFYTYPEETIIIYGGLMKMLPGQVGNFILSVPGGYVFTDLNPGLEDWTGGYPDAWNISISSPYNIPSTWNSYYSTSSVVQSSDEYQGTYAAQLISARNFEKSLASAYFILPGAVEEGEYTASIYYAGNPQTVQMVLEIALYDDSDALIGSATGDMSVGPSGAYKLNSISYDTDTDLPKYVRFNVRQAVGQSRDENVRVDNLSLRGPLGDISLPAVFGGVTESDYESYRKIEMSWFTWSEVGTHQWKLFRNPGSPTLVSGGAATAAGTDPNGKTYTDFDYYLFTTPWNMLTSSGELEVFLGCKDIYGGWEYFTGPNELVTIEYP